MQKTGWVLGWEDAAMAGAAACGGKGWNLGRLHRYGFPVPAGGVLVAEAYTGFVNPPGIASQIRKVAAMSARDVTAPEAAQQLADIRAAIEAADLAPEVWADLERLLAGPGLEGAAVAVRSSATAEDGAEHSFAGIHQSFLGLRGLPAVIDAVKRCYASLWTPQAVAYRRHRNLSDEAVACAVVICAMVTSPGTDAPAVAGVAFTCDPRTGRRDLITISAAPGLGEAVVSGAVNPEEISIRMQYDAMSLQGRSGRPDRVLTDEQAFALARQAVRVHWALGDDQAPQDIEWAFDGSQFVLLQARPVTKLPLVTFPGAERLPIIWSNANLKDALPGVQSTMSWSLSKPTIGHVMYSNLAPAGYPMPDGHEVIRRIKGRAYFDLTAMQWAMYDGIGIPPAEFITSLGGHQPLIPIPSSHPFRGRTGLRRRLSQVRFALGLRRSMMDLPRRIGEYRGKLREMRLRDVATLTREDFLARVRERVDLNLDFGPRFMAASMNAGMWTTLLFRAVQRFAPARAQALASALLAAGGGITTAEHGYRLFDLAAVARKDEQALAYLTRRPLDPQGWRRLPAASPFRQEFERYLDEFGHRAVYEAELANPRWNEDPTYLLEQVCFLLESGKAQDPRSVARGARTRGTDELAQLPCHARAVVKWLVRKAQAAAAFREATKSALVATAEPGRLDIREIGRRLAAAGKLGAPADVFHLAWADLVLYLRGEWDGTGAQALVADRQARDAAWLAEEPADFYIVDAEGHPAEMSGAPAPDVVARPAEQAARGGNVLTGIGVASGRATGIARVIRHPSEGHLLQDGDVLVAPSTDPGWTPLFLRVAAVAMEVGGYLSHGAIVAREYGLPAVVNIPGLLSRVENGQRLVVDGDTGTVSFE